MSGYLNLDSSYFPNEFLMWDDRVGKLKLTSMGRATPLSIINKKIKDLLKTEKEGDYFYDIQKKKSLFIFLFASEELFNTRRFNRPINIKDLLKTNSICIRIQKLFPSMEPKPLCEYLTQCDHCLNAPQDEETSVTLKRFLNHYIPTSISPLDFGVVYLSDQEKFLMFLHRCFKENRHEIIYSAIKEAHPTFIQNCLLRCVVDGDEILVPFLLKKFSASTMDRFESYFLESVKQGNIKIITHFLDAGAQINLPGRALSPLHIACTRGRADYNNAEIVKFLLEKGADKHGWGCWDLTPLEQAIKDDLKDCVALLTSSQE